jgi:hypothetical protein
MNVLLPLMKPGLSLSDAEVIPGVDDQANVIPAGSIPSK